MKTTLATFIAAAFAVGLAASVSAAPPGKGPFETKTYKQAATQAEIQSLKKGDRYALVCTECRSITVKEVADDKQAEALCHNGGTLHCDACKKKVTIQHAGPPGKGTDTSKVIYVNAEGKECMFIVPVKN
jgi:hypothetical protein